MLGLQITRARRFVVVESPFAGDEEVNTVYAQWALRDSISRNETPYACHLLVTQALSERAERNVGLQVCNAVKGPRVYYVDRCPYVPQASRHPQPGGYELRKKFTEQTDEVQAQMIVKYVEIVALLVMAAVLCQPVLWRWLLAGLSLPSYAEILVPVTCCVAATNVIPRLVRAVAFIRDGYRFHNARRLFSDGMFRAFMLHGGTLREMYRSQPNVVEVVENNQPPTRRLSAEVPLESRGENTL